MRPRRRFRIARVRMRSNERFRSKLKVRFGLPLEILEAALAALRAPALRRPDSDLVMSRLQWNRTTPDPPTRGISKLGLALLVATFCAAHSTTACGSNDAFYAGSASGNPSIDAGAVSADVSDGGDGLEIDWDFEVRPGDRHDTDADADADADSSDVGRDPSDADADSSDVGRDPSDADPSDADAETSDTDADPSDADPSDADTSDADPSDADTSDDVSPDAPDVDPPCGDLDGDGVCDLDDVCTLGDDTVDIDADGVPDACDVCEGFDDAMDGDLDGVPNGCDVCRGDDTADVDSDGVADACDVCPDADDRSDADDDKIPDACDTCAGGDDRIDSDGDGVPDACDPCPADSPDDSDGDGVCDREDVCWGDDGRDTDSDGAPDACDPCPLDWPDDTDFDGVCESYDVCPGGDDRADGDGDRVPDGCDPCPQDSPDDSDGDGTCDADDRCAGGDDTRDSDRDGVPDACDPCPDDAGDDFDGDGVCDREDVCAGGDDRVDGDLDGVPDFCDPCPLDVADDSDADGVCDFDDICDGGDDTVDADGDATPDFCDGCPRNPDKAEPGFCGCGLPEGLCAISGGAVFPATGDTRSIRFGTNLWNVGDSIEGERVFEAVGSPTELSVVVPFENNVLSCARQKMAVSLNGVLVGVFEIVPGADEVAAVFPVAGVDSADVYTVRYETTETVREGCGSAGIQNDIGTIDVTFGADTPIEFAFPLETDLHLVEVGTNLWNAGDSIAGTREVEFTVEPTSIALALPVEHNVLSCDFQAMAFSVNGVELGIFEIGVGDTEVRAAFPADGIVGQTFAFRIETAETVADGCGSAGIASGSGTIAFGF